MRTIHQGALFEVLSQNKLGFLQDPFAILLVISGLELCQSAFRISGYQGSLSKMTSGSENQSASGVYESLAGPSTCLSMQLQHERLVLTSIDKTLRQVLGIRENNLKPFKYQISKHLDGKMQCQTILNLEWYDRLKIESMARDFLSQGHNFTGDDEMGTTTTGRSDREPRFAPGGFIILSAMKARECHQCSHTAAQFTSLLSACPAAR